MIEKAVIAYAEASELMAIFIKSTETAKLNAGIKDR
jgi:hypothetical protein